VPATRLVGITHPFHPYRGRQLVCVGERCNAAGKRLLLSIDEDTVCAVPLQWTNLVAPDPEVVLGEARAAMRVGDLVELARLVARLSGRDARTAPEDVSGELCRKRK
jgi:hypothetical protein